MSKPVILTGLRANNDLHIGNYLGALLPLVDMAKQKADDYQINLFIPDLHSFTTPIDHSKLQAAIMQNLRVFVAAGLPLDHDNVHIYRQSYIPAHSELTWILDCFTEVGEMSRMTQYRDKGGRLTARDLAFKAMELLRTEMGDEYWSEDAEVIQEKINAKINQLAEKDKTALNTVGLLSYPVLMAADILLYGAEYIPVGDDQTQHLEFTRDIAERMNKKFDTDLFVVPEPVTKQHEFFGKDQGLRIKDLIDPTKKMSKSSDSDKGVIFLTDEPLEAANKVLKSTTDTVGAINYNPQKQPGISNLLQIYSLLINQPIEDLNNSAWKRSEYYQLKNVVADRVKIFITDFQEKLAQVDDKKILAKLKQSETQMNEQSRVTLKRVQQAVGLRP